MEVRDVLSNPTLGYRLDPGEPGLLRSATAKDSTRAVTSQEQRNINRLKSEAALRGEVVIAANITYTRAIAGSFAAVQAGLTTVTTVPAEEHLKKLTAQQVTTNDQETTETANPPDETSSTEPQAPQSTATNTSSNVNELQREELNIQLKIAALKQELSNASSGKNIPTAGSNGTVANIISQANATEGNPAQTAVRTQTPAVATVGTGRDAAAIQLEMQILSQQLSKIQTDRFLAEMGSPNNSPGQIHVVGSSLDVIA